LKCIETCDQCPNAAVTPHAGVWIEIDLPALPARGVSVTPHAGVWIEMRINRPATTMFPGHTPRGCVD